ncbi:hypothetical protein HNY73_007744 [Argiope bruennichi]|uniref:Uncharacterized protein n=1 Tax=Argiope bruennichi TaxID=94029 RepID=A0A8T0FEX7_ARGBR|nr:hypothetical protein HNY73_007744 [Argiope bruennichi]
MVMLTPYREEPCSNACSYCTTVEKKYDMITPVIRQIKDSVSTQIDRWSDKEVREAQLTDPDIKPILELLESLALDPVGKILQLSSDSNAIGLSGIHSIF